MPHWGLCTDFKRKIYLFGNTNFLNLNIENWIQKQPRIRNPLFKKAWLVLYLSHLQKCNPTFYIFVENPGLSFKAMALVFMFWICTHFFSSKNAIFRIQFSNVLILGNCCFETHIFAKLWASLVWLVVCLML